MNRISLILICFGLLAAAQIDAIPQPDQIIELFRHGARGPVNTYDDSWTIDQYGMLTPVGMRQHYILGKVLAEKYPNLVGSSYNYSQVYVLSDTTPRCIQSAGAHLYGMYLGTGPSLASDYPSELAVPPFNDNRVQEIADSLPNSEALPNNFVPSVINIVDASNAVIFQGDWKYCPNQALWEDQNGNDSLTQQAFQIFGETIANVNSYLDESDQLTTATDIWEFGDTVLVDVYDNRTIPGGISDPELITNYTWAYTWFTYHLWNGQLQQKQTGAFNTIQAILGQLEAFRSGQNYNKVAMFSGHDDNILAVLGAFGVISEDCILANFYSVVANGTLQFPYCFYPYFASDIVFEFYNNTENPYVKAFYNNQIIPICGGQYTCDYDDFIAFAQNATGNLTIDQYFQQCGTNATFLASKGYTNVTPAEYNRIDTFAVYNKNNTRIETLAIIGLTILCAMLFAKIIFDKKKYSQAMKKDECMIYNQIAA